MARFIISYIGGDQPSTPEAGKQHFAQYQAWLQSLGAAAISPMNPFKGTRTVRPDGTVEAGSSTGMNGYTVIESASMDDVLAMAKSCPFLSINGSLEVSELMQMG